MKYTTNAINILTAQMYKGIGNAWVVQNIHPHITITQIVELLKTRKINTTEEEFLSRRRLIMNRLPHLYDRIDGITAFGDDDFPYIRGKVNDSAKPTVLYYRGDLSLLQSKNRNIAVIGLLNPDKHTIEEESQVVAKLAEYGFCIVSGLAVGCDTVAHSQALQYGAKTIAILPSSIDKILPKQNIQLAENIVASGGLLISEYAKEATSQLELRARYDARDRLQVQFSDGVVLSASYSQKDIGCDSGSRLAMNYAKVYQQPRFVLYNQERDINNPKYNLTRELLSDQDGRPQELQVDRIYEQLLHLGHTPQQATMQLLAF